MPVNTTFEEAAAVCMGMIRALTCLRTARLRGGGRLLIYGASGSVGTAAVQLAKHFDAHVTAVCNTKNIEILRSIGADEVIDYEQDDFTRNGEKYDVIFHAVGKHSFRRCRRSLVRGGNFVVADLGFMWQNPFLALVTLFIGSKRVKLPFALHPDPKQDVALLKELIEAGRYVAVIDRSYPLQHVVDATKYVETEQKTGNVVLTISHSDRPAPPAGR
jgi:NADPH:quinone reductase-like Zn-dependent oxidoreductase